MQNAAKPTQRHSPTRQGNHQKQEQTVDGRQGEHDHHVRQRAYGDYQVEAGEDQVQVYPLQQGYPPAVTRFQ